MTTSIAAKPVLAHPALDALPQNGKLAAPLELGSTRLHDKKQAQADQALTLALDSVPQGLTFSSQKVELEAPADPSLLNNMDSTRILGILNALGKRPSGGSQDAKTKEAKGQAGHGHAVSTNVDDMGSLMLMLGLMQGNLAAEEASAATSDITTSNETLAARQKAQIDALQKQLDAQAKADKVQSPVLKWFTKIAAVVGAVVGVAAAIALSAVSGGLATPLLAVACIGLAAATFDLASTISQANGGPSFDISGPLETKISSGLIALGVPKSKVDGISKLITGIALSVTGFALINPSSFGETFGGIAELAGASQDQAAYVAGAFTAALEIGMAIAAIAMTGGASAAGEVSEATGLVGKIQQLVMQGGAKLQFGMKCVNITTDVVSAGGNIAAGGVNIDASVLQRSADELTAQGTSLGADIASLQIETAQDTQVLNTVMNYYKSLPQLISSIIKSLAQARQQATSIAVA
ncbi:type III secretion system translocon subunit SctE [Paraburkholderia hayleyella]|uniref:type III secretion system translocon subunit SctE n=1 Tax=Paraburkholderia hayleyella TaxID=2152889 RepID=UPI0012915850|nr:type III secretion system translocon subunit SctE [Paraburkholderia hayleyella]